MHLDKAARKRARQGERVVEPGAVEHRPWAGAGGAQHREHRGLAEALGGGHRLWLAKPLHEGFLDLILGQQRQAKLARERRGQRALARSGPAGDEHEATVSQLAPATGHRHTLLATRRGSADTSARSRVGLVTKIGQEAVVVGYLVLFRR